MEAVMGMIPWEIVLTWLGTEVVSYACGKTNWFEAGSIFELAQNLICKALDKNHKI